MDSNIQQPADNSKLNPWQWLIQSPTRMVGLTFLAIAFVLMLALMVLVSPKANKKTAVVPQANFAPNNSQNNSFIPPLPLPDPTKDWQLVSKRDFSLKVPSFAMTISKENINGASSSAYLRVILDPKEATQTAALIEVTKKTGTDLSQQVYLLNLNNPNVRVITKPIDILIGGFKGYEFYLEGSDVKGYFGSSSFKEGKIRIIEFSTNDKHYVLIDSLDPQIETILSTLRVK